MTPHLTASPSCKELSIPERAVDKKTPHKGDRQQKECLTTLGWTISITTSFTKTAADGVQKGRLFMAEKTMDNKDYADTLLLNMIDKYGIHVMYIVIIIELIHYMW